MAASPRYNCLYVSDIVLNAVHLYNLSNNVITRWSVVGRCYGLSLTSTHNVLVTLLHTRRVQEYSPDGRRQIRAINLDGSIEYPLHTVQLSSDQLLVSHGLGGTLNRVCLVNMSGSIIQCYGRAAGSGVGQLNDPRDLAVDKHGNVLVADSGNHRVVLLSPSLTRLRYIAVPGHELSEPSALHLDLLTHRLYIGEWSGTARVFVLGVDDS